MKPTTISPTHKSITTYYATLHSLAHQNTTHEMGLRIASCSNINLQLSLSKTTHAKHLRLEL